MDALKQISRARERDAFDRSIDALTVRPRKLIEDEPASPQYIKTVWGVGYVFNSATRGYANRPHASAARAAVNRVRGWGFRLASVSDSCTAARWQRS
jgi:DNA-binding winged helix-turn-helix (wHTH) protein